MKRIFISAVTILLATAAVQAQTDTTKRFHHERHDMQKEGPYARLNLTAEQQAKMQTLREEFRQKREAVKNEKLTEVERKAQLQTLQQQYKTATDAVLTPAQKEQLEKMKSERKKGMRGGKRMNGDSSVTRNNRGANLQKELALTADQQAKMKSIRTDFKSKAAALRNDQALTQEQKRAKLRELMKQQQEQVKTVLTKEQQEKLQSLRKDRPAPDTK